MSPLELRYEIYKHLTRLPRPAALKSAGLISPEPGRPVEIMVVVDDAYSTPPAVRKYRVTVEEIT